MRVREGFVTFVLCVFYLLHLQMYDNKSLQNRLICGEIVPFFMMFLFVLYDKYVIVNLVYE